MKRLRITQGAIEGAMPENELSVIKSEMKRFVDEPAQRIAKLVAMGGAHIS